MLKNIIVIEHEGAETRAMSLAFDVPDPQFDIEAAVKAASTDYCKTEAGKVVYKHNLTGLTSREIYLITSVRNTVLNWFAVSAQRQSSSIGMSSLQMILKSDAQNTWTL